MIFYNRARSFGSSSERTQQLATVEILD